MKTTTHKVETTADGRRYVDLTPQQLLEALGRARPKTMAEVNAKAKAWAKARGFDGARDWSIDDLVLHDLAARVKARRLPGRNGSIRSFGSFRWL